MSRLINGEIMIIFKGNYVMIQQGNETDICSIDFISCYGSESSLSCHKDEVYDVIVHELDRKEKEMKELASPQIREILKINRSDLDSLKKLFVSMA